HRSSSDKGKPGRAASSRPEACCAPGNCARRPTLSWRAALRLDDRCRMCRARSSSASSASYDPFLGGRCIMKNKMSGWQDSLDLLECIGEAHQMRRMPRCSPATEREGAIVVAAAGTQPYTAGIEADERQEHDIEPAGADDPHALGLADTQSIGSLPIGHLDEAHAASVPVAIDPRQIDAATTDARNCQERRGIELFGK